MLSSGFERSTTRWKLVPNGVAEVLEHRAAALDDVGRVELERAAPASYAGAPCAASATRTTAEGPTQSSDGNPMRAAGARPGPGRRDHDEHQPGRDDQRCGLARQRAHCQERARDEREPGGDGGARPRPQSHGRQQQEREQIGAALSAHRVERERRDHERGGRCVGDDGASSCEHRHQRDHRRRASPPPRCSARGRPWRWWAGLP